MFWEVRSCIVGKMEEIHTFEYKFDCNIKNFDNQPLELDFGYLLEAFEKCSILDNNYID